MALLPRRHRRLRGGPPPPPSRTKWTRLVHPSVLTGHVSSLSLKSAVSAPGPAPHAPRHRPGARIPPFPIVPPTELFYYSLRGSGLLPLHAPSLLLQKMKPQRFTDEFPPAAPSARPRNSALTPPLPPVLTGHVSSLSLKSALCALTPPLPPSPPAPRTDRTRLVPPLVLIGHASSTSAPGPARERQGGMIGARGRPRGAERRGAR